MNQNSIKKALTDRHTLSVLLLVYKLPSYSFKTHSSPRVSVNNPDVCSVSSIN